MAQLAISLLGTVQIQRDKQPIGGFAYNKARALLVYLVVEIDHPHQRDVIVGLLWPDMPDAAARTNLRQVLTSLRDTIGPGDPDAPFLIATRDTVQFNPDSDYALDVACFNSLLDECAHHRHRHISRCPACAARLAEAVSLYRGDFLAAFPAVDSAPFEEWLVIKREAVQQRAVEALAHLAQHYERWGAEARARQTLTRLIELEPWDEAAHMHLMRLLYRAGQRGAALAQYETCRRILADQFAVEPIAALQQLYEQIRIGKPIEEVAPARSINLPIATTTLIGRARELAELGALLSDPSQRLLTLVGPGGIGKTRLALAAAAANAPMFEAGAAFVSLAALTSAELLPLTILSALGVTPEQQLDPAQQLSAYLRPREMLLVLDNVEQLLPDVDLIVRLLRHAPRLTLLVTSRERLAVQAEQVFELTGLEYPIDDTVDQKQYQAVQLFLDRAQRVQRKFQLAPDNAATIARICRLVEGLPLAIELAASTVNVQSCAAIADEITAGLKSLVTKLRDVPERHRSLWAVCEHSWQLLNAAEQTAFSQLSIFRGGFDQAAAQHVVEADPEMLAALIDKSLVRREGGREGVREGDERFDLHELLRQYAGERLALVPDDAAAAAARHSAYYLRRLQEQVARFSSTRQSAAYAELLLDVDNLRAAWRWAVRQRQWTVIQSSALDLISWCDYQVHNADGYHLFAEALDQLQIGAAPAVELEPERASAEGQVLTGHGYFLWRMGHNQRAQSDLQRGLERLRQAGDLIGVADNLIGLGAVTASLGQYDLALAHFEESATLYDRLQDRTGHALAILQAGIVNRTRGNYAAAQAQMEHALTEYRQLGDQKMVSNCLSHYARLLVLMGQIDRAQARAQESLTLSRALNDRWTNGGALMAVGQVEYARGHYREAVRVLAESVRECADLNEFERMVDALIWQALAEIASGELLAADEQLREALRLARQGSVVRCQLGALCGLAETWTRSDQFERALETVLYVQQHPAVEHGMADRAARLSAELGACLSSPQITVIQQRAATRSLNEMIDAVVNDRL
jgi:predicted ATPase/DNA-binding SARP family transcriptional activator